MATITGNGTSETLNGTAESDLIDGRGGNDTINGLAGEDEIIGGRGHDTLNGGDGDDLFLYDGTNNGFDTLNGEAGTDVAMAVSAGTVIGVDGYNNGVEEFLGDITGDTIIRDRSGSHTLDFANTTLTDIAEVDARNGHDVVTASNLSDGAYRGGGGHDTLNAGGQTTTWLYSGTNNGFDTFNNGAGQSTARAEDVGTIIGVDGYANGVDAFEGHASGDTVIQDRGGSHTLDFSNTALSNIDEVNAGGGHDVVTASNLGAGEYRGGRGNDTLNAGDAATTWLYSGDRNGFDTFSRGTGESVALAETAGTIIGVDGYANGVDAFEGHASGDTVIQDRGGSHTLDFSSTALSHIAEIDARGGHDTVRTSNESAANYRGGRGNDTFEIGAADATFLYDDTNNGRDTFTGNVAGDGQISTILAEAPGAVIGLTNNFVDGVDVIDVNNLAGVRVVGTGGADTLDFTDVTVINNPDDFEIDGGNGQDTITGTSSVDRVLGGRGNDTINDSGGFDEIIGGLGADLINLSGVDGTGDEIFLLSVDEFGDTATGFNIAGPAVGGDLLNLEDVLDGFITSNPATALQDAVDTGFVSFAGDATQTQVLVDTNGNLDGITDFQVALTLDGLSFVDINTSIFDLGDNIVTGVILE
ncbi:MAG: calcium-binding protein [Hyphomicrobiales bacterium]|nr:calcium-binding protein [Hyphomicrobiales bacterium]